MLKEQVARIRKETRAAERDVAELLATPRGDRPEKILRARARYRGTGVVDRLLREYWQIIYTDPHEALQLAELAWTAAKASHGVPRIHELIALAASCIGNAARASGDLNTADRWFGHVRSLLNQEDVRAISVLAKIDWLEGSLRKDQRRLGEAVDVLNRALTLFRAAGMRTDVIRALLTLGETHYARGRMRTAAEKAREALLLIDRENEPRLYLCARHNLTLYISEQGRYFEAAEILNANMDEHRAHDDVSIMLHVAWLGGRISAGLGDIAEAEQQFLSVREGFLAQGNAFHAAFVCLDLALLYLKQQRTTEVKALAEAMVSVFEAQGVHREATVAKRLIRYLEEAKADPSLRFEP